MKYTSATLVALCFAAAGTLAAQDQFFFQSGATFNSFQGQTFDVVAMDPLSLGPVVADAPYSAEAVTEFTQILADGNRIERRTSGKVARNSQGGVRREQGISFGPLAAANVPQIVTIDDPANGVHLMLNYEAKLASRIRTMSSTIMSAPGGATAVAFGSGAGPHGSVQGGAMIATTPEDKIQIGAAAAAGSLMTWSAAVTAPGTRFEGDVKKEQLEPREIEGLRAEGTRSTVTLPAGSVGNTLPIEIVNERWYSPELQVVLLTRQIDPRIGETIYRLTNIDRSEPAPDLFKVPDGFTIQDGPAALPRMRKPPQ